MTTSAAPLYESHRAYASPLTDQLYDDLSRLASQGGGFRESYAPGPFADRYYENMLNFAYNSIQTDQTDATTPMLHVNAPPTGIPLENETLVHYVEKCNTVQAARVYTKPGTGPIYSQIDNIQPDKRSVAIVLTEGGGAYLFNGDEGHDVGKAEGTRDNEASFFEVNTETKSHIKIGQPMIIRNQNLGAVKTVLVLEAEPKPDEDNAVFAYRETAPFRQAEEILAFNKKSETGVFIDQPLPEEVIEKSNTELPDTSSTKSKHRLRRLGSRLLKQEGRIIAQPDFLTTTVAPYEAPDQQVEKQRRHRSLARFQLGRLAIAVLTYPAMKAEDKQLKLESSSEEKPDRRSTRKRAIKTLGAAAAIGALVYVHYRIGHSPIPTGHEDGLSLGHHALQKPHPIVPQTQEGHPETLAPGGTIEGTVEKYLENNKLANPDHPATFSKAVFRITSEILHKSGVTWNGSRHLKSGFRFNMPSLRQVKSIVNASSYAGKHAA